MATNPLTGAETTDICRLLGYPIFSGLATDGTDPAADLANLQAILAGLTDDQLAVVRTMLTNLRQLEADLYAVRANADTAKAAVWTRNPTELAEREALMWSFQRRMAGFVGVTLGPGVVQPGAALVPAMFTV